MIFENPELQESLKTGFINSIHPSRPDYLPQLLHNDREKGTKILSSIQNELQKCDEFWFSVAFLTTSGVATLINTLAELEKRNIKGKILVSAYLHFTQPEALRRILKFSNIELRILMHGEFHSKGYLFKRGDLYNLIIGSSNLTASALCTNKEWNLKVTATPQSKIIINAIDLFNKEFNNAIIVNNISIVNYEIGYRLKLDYQKRLKESDNQSKLREEIKPNKMQIEALENLKRLRKNGEKRALLISATGSGKTYLSAFDVKEKNPSKILFIVHRRTIANAALNTFRKIFGTSKTYGLYSGDKLENNKDFIFATIQTISKDEHLKKFGKDEFGYIVIDEAHRAEAKSYKKIVNHFTPDFFLGMTATPERTDGIDILKLFNFNIAFELRLHKAMDEDMLSPFHYYGVSDLSIDGDIINDFSNFNQLTSDQRISHIIEKIEFYGCDDGHTRGLVFCPKGKLAETKKIAEAFNQKGYRSVFLTKDSTEKEREDAIISLESDESDRVKYIFTIDIFNEGVDIPRVNQVVMLRPTESAIIFVQQLGRGLRKIDNKKYLTVIDFIGNYNNNYLVPIALYGKKSFSKDVLRQVIDNGSEILPGTSTINFDEISKKRIFDSIDQSNLRLMKDLKRDFIVLKSKLNRLPYMIDFLNNDSRNPFDFVKACKSYYSFLKSINEVESNNIKISKIQVDLIDFFSNEINNGKRPEESIILQHLLDNQTLSYSKFAEIITQKFNLKTNYNSFNSAVRNINSEFNRTKNDIDIKIIEVNGDLISYSDKFLIELRSEVFKSFFIDTIRYSLIDFSSSINLMEFHNGFKLYKKYKHVDIFRILNWEKNPVPLNVGGYIISSDKSNCPIFVNYKKGDDISDTIKYEDEFIDQNTFRWISKSNRTLESNDVKTLLEMKDIFLPLFIRKSKKDEDFFYMGPIRIKPNQFELGKMKKEETGQLLPIVIFQCEMLVPVEDNLYKYLTEL